MRRASAAALVAVAVLGLPRPGHPQAAGDALTAEIPFSFEGRRFTVQLPQGYKLFDEAVPMPGYKYFGFAGPPNASGLSGVLQIALFDLKVAGPTPLSLFVETQSAGLRNSHLDWKATQAPTRVTGVPAVRLRWSGRLRLPDGRQPPVEGVTILGVKGDMAFRLEAFDEPERAAQLAAREKALTTFALADP